MQQIVKAQHPHELLQLAPIIAGGTPTKSALLLLFCGKRAGSALRIDLPESQEAEKPWADAALRVVSSVGAEAIVVILYPSEEIGPRELPYRHLATALRASADEHRIDLRDTFVVGDDYWGDYREPDAPMAPVAEIAELDARFDGLPRASELASGPRGLPKQLRGKDEEQQRARVDALVDDPEAVDPIAITAKAVAGGPDLLDCVTAAKLSTLSQLAITRELILTTLIAGAAEAQQLDSAVGGAAAELQLEVRQRTSRILIGEAEDVSMERLRRSLRLWEAVAALTVREQLAPVLGMLGWLHWATGMRSIAAACAERAIELDPSFSLPRSVLRLTDSGHMPRWYRMQVRHPSASGN